MAISAAGTMGAASVMAGSATAGAVAAGTATAAAAAATASSTTSIALSTVALGTIAVSAGAATAFRPTAPPLCSEPVIKISFDRESNSLAADIMEGKGGDWSQLGGQIVQVYNSISEDCYETHPRKMINCSHLYEEYNIEDNVIDTFWAPYVMCNSSCPTEDPLFGIDTPDLITRMLQNFDPRSEGATSNQFSVPRSSTALRSSTGTPSSASLSSVEPSRSPSSAPSIRPNVPICRNKFLEGIGASNIYPSKCTEFESQTISPSSTPSLNPSTATSEQPSVFPREMPSTSFQVFFSVMGKALTAEIEQKFVKAILSTLGVPKQDLNTFIPTNLKRFLQ